ncbi:hypothetical protein K492DRAFT_16938 [Lichtheimia hyalospora FSU 10163]|nr:hypothetical protein K492DRAFT_16938 [Lichtheimia hyalospora FSU 10163]
MKCIIIMLLVVVLLFQYHQIYHRRPQLLRNNIKQQYLKIHNIMHHPLLGGNKHHWIMLAKLTWLPNIMNAHWRLIGNSKRIRKRSI